MSPSGSAVARNAATSTDESARIKVVAVQPGIAGGYACRLLIDAGAEASVLLPPGGLWLQKWASSGVPAAAGLLFEHYFAGARRVDTSRADLDELFDGADVVLLDRIRDDALAEDVAAAMHAHPELVVVDIGTFGDHRPVTARPANEFSLQAACGSTGSRGVPGQRPIAAGGYLGESAAGAFAALASVIALHETRTSGRGVQVSVSMFEAMVSVYDSFEWLRTAFYDPPRDFGVWVDNPGVEQVRGGWVGLTCVTPSQWAAFVDMTGAEEFVGDASLGSLLGRVHLGQRIDELCGPWLRSHTVDEVLAEASSRGIPCSPVGNGQTLPEFDHMRARDFYRASDGAVRRPASPIILTGTRLGGAADAPLAQWAGLDMRAAESAGSSPWHREGLEGPLAGLRVLDLGAYWAGPGASVILASLGACVLKVEGVTRPDGMRQSTARSRTDANWWEYTAIYHGANVGKADVTLELSVPEGRSALLHLVADVDLLIENFAPGVMERLGLTFEELRKHNPRIVMVRMPAFGLSGPWRERRGYATTMDQISGISWVTGERGGRPIGAKSFGDFNGSIHAAFASLLALARRRISGVGLQVEVALAEACLSVTADQVVEYSGAGTLLVRDGSRRPDAAPQGIYRAADGHWVAASVLSDDAWAAFSAMFAPELADHCHSLAQRLAEPHLGETALESAVNGSASEDVVARLRRIGVAAEIVTSPSFVDADVDLQATGFFRTLPHPLLGPLSYPTLPFTIGGRRFGPISAAPTYGQHNYLLPGLLGVSDHEMARLRATGVVSDSPRG